VTCDDFKGTLKVERSFALLGVEVEGAKFHFSKTAEEFEGGSLDIVFFGDFGERIMNIGVCCYCAHEDSGARWVYLFNGCGHDL
jgi:hypothetical protein